MNRLDELNEKLSARTDRDGKPLQGYRANVAAIRGEIARLTCRPAPIADPQESPQT